MREVTLGQHGAQTGCVMVVDDERQNRELLREILTAEGHRVAEAEDGQQAIARIRETLPDVVLLDVMMPLVTGFEVCRQLKSDAATAHIPVLMVTSLADREARLLGIEAGANDFLPKPIDKQDVVLRVRNAIFTKHLFDQLQQSYRRLQELERLKDNLTHMIVHDLRSPLTGMKGYIDLLRMAAWDRLTEKERDYLQNAQDVTRRLVEMISSILDVARLEAGQMSVKTTECDLQGLLDDAIKPLRSRAELKRLRLELSTEPVRCKCDPVIIGRVIGNLVDNAIKFTPEGGEIRVSVTQDESQVTVTVSDTGFGIPREFRERVFEKFAQVDARQKHQMHSTGLGLAYCKLAVEANGGRIGLDSELDKGSTFWFTLPKNERAHLS